MVTVVVVHEAAVQFPLIFHPPFSPRKARETARDRLGRKTRVVARGKGREGVHHVVPTGYGKLYRCDRLSAVQHRKGVPSAVFTDIICEEIDLVAVLCLYAEGKQPSAEIRERRTDVFVVGVIDHASVLFPEGLICKLPIGGADMLHRLKVIDVVHFHIEDDRRRRIEIEEGIHILAGLEDEAVALADAVIAAHRAKRRARGYRRIGLCRHEDLGAHRGRR